MSDLGRFAAEQGRAPRIALPPAEEIDRLRQQVDEIYSLLDKIAMAIVGHDEQIKEISQFIVSVIRESNARRESNTVADESQGQSGDGRDEPSASAAV